MKNPENICGEVTLQIVQFSEGSLCLKCIWHIECVMITDVLLQIWTVAYLPIIMNSHISCPAKRCNRAHLQQSNNVFKFKNIY